MDAINLTTETTEVPKAFTEAYEEIKQQQENPVAVEDKPKRGRPRKVRDELDVNTNIDEVDKIVEEKPAEVEETAEEEIEENAQEEQKYIDEQLVDAGRKAGLSDETIQRLATESPGVLKDLTKPKAEVRTVVSQKPEVIEPDDMFKPVDFKVDKDLYGEDLSNTVDALVSRINSQTTIMKQLMQQNQVVARDIQSRQIADMDRSFDTMMDKVGSDLPAVGKTEKITPNSNEWNTRSQIWQKADILRKGNPQMSFEDSVDDAVSWYRGKHGSKFIEQNVITKIKAREGKLLYRPTHKQPVETVYKTEQERAVAAIERVKQKHQL